MFTNYQCLLIILIVATISNSQLTESRTLISNGAPATSTSNRNRSLIGFPTLNSTNQSATKQRLSIETNSIQRLVVETSENNGGSGGGGGDQSRSLKRVFLSNRTVTCNDGSQAGFYLRKSPISKRWIVFLEGGWHCYDTKSCRMRWMKLRHLMTSAQWAETRDVGGILSPLRQENPYWHNANHVLVPYCSSDSWSGTKAQASGRDTWAFMGMLIIRQVIADLIPLGLGRASGSELLLVGSSAGGLGVMLNLDRINQFLQNERNLRVTVRGISDSGWFLDREPYTPSAVASSEAVRQGWKMWEGALPDACTKQHTLEPWRCYFGYRLYPTLESPLFVFQWLFDEAQMRADNVGAPVTPQQWNYIHEMGGALRTSLDNVSAVFAPSCIGHAVLSKRDWVNIKIDDISLPNALRCWEQSTRRHKNNTNNNNNKMRRSTEASVALGDRKRNSNRRKHNQRHKHAEELVDSAKPRQRHLTKEKRQQKRRHNQQQQRKRNKSQNNEKNNHRRKQNMVDGGKSTKHDNSISERSESQTTSFRPHKNRKRFHKDSNGNRHPETSEDLDRRERNRRRRRRRKEQQIRQEQEDRQYQKEQPQQLQQQQSHEQQLQQRTSANDANNSQQFTNNLSRDKSTTTTTPMPQRCDLRLLERCSWPQCNHSCPSLTNPLTGEEMRFLELLSSFGLDIEGVAAALGVDMQTLNNMDRTELVNLLTQQVN